MFSVGWCLLELGWSSRCLDCFVRFSFSCCSRLSSSPVVQAIPTRMMSIRNYQPFPQEMILIPTPRATDSLKSNQVRYHFWYMPLQLQIRNLSSVLWKTLMGMNYWRPLESLPGNPMDKLISWFPFLPAMTRNPESGVILQPITASLNWRSEPVTFLKLPPSRFSHLFQDPKIFLQHWILWKTYTLKMGLT